MKTSLIVLAAVSILGLSAPRLPAAETVYDGTFWQNASPAIKGFYVQGVLSGILLGQDRVLRQGLPGVGPAPLSPECRRDLTRIVNALERRIVRWDAGRLIQALDTFYEEPDHRGLGVRWALMAVVLEMDGGDGEGLPQP